MGHLEKCAGGCSEAVVRRMHVCTGPALSYHNHAIVLLCVRAAWMFETWLREMLTLHVGAPPSWAQPLPDPRTNVTVAASATAALRFVKTGHEV